MDFLRAARALSLALAMSAAACSSQGAAASVPEAETGATACKTTGWQMPKSLPCASASAFPDAPATWLDVRASCGTAGSLHAACGGHLGLSRGWGVDSEYLFLYEEGTGRIFAKLSAGNGQDWQCMGSVGGVAIDTTTCWTANGFDGCDFNSGKYEPCQADAGTSDADAQALEDSSADGG